jgi:hypothetical protein
MLGVATLGQDPRKIAEAYDAVAEEYAAAFAGEHERKPQDKEVLDRKSTRLNSSHNPASRMPSSA